MSGTQRMTDLFLIMYGLYFASKDRGRVVQVAKNGIV